MITAREAREETIRCCEEMDNHIIQQIMAAINKAVSEGEFKTEIPKCVPYWVDTVLTKLGYEVIKSSSRDKEYTIIRWE